jgi:hypothetical protein
MVAGLVTSRVPHTTLAAARSRGPLLAAGELDDHDARTALLHAAAGHVGMDG